MLEIASGPNEYVNLCDLTCLVVLSRYSFEHQLRSQLSPKAGESTLKKLVEFERQIIELARVSLGEDAQQKLKTSVTTWVETMYEPGMALLSRYRGLSAEVVQTSDASPDEKSRLLGSLMIDPLAGLDPTVREIAQTRLFAERAMFVAQRMPKILRIEGELMSHRFIEAPQTTQLLTELDTVTQSFDRMSGVVEALPALLQSEREAVMKALEQQTPQLTGLMDETRATFEASTQAMVATNTVVQSTDRFLERLGVYDPPETSSAGTAAQPGEPFRIQDYTTAAAQLAVSAEKLNSLIVSLDRTLVTATTPELTDKVTAASQAAIAGGRKLVDHVFWRALSLIMLIAGLTPIVVYACRRLTRNSRAPSKA
jgi:hypothetical protein